MMCIAYRLFKWGYYEKRAGGSLFSSPVAEFLIWERFVIVELYVMSQWLKENLVDKY